LDFGLPYIGFNFPCLAIFILSKESELCFLDQNGFNSPENNSLSFFLVSLDKGLPFLNSAIKFLDVSECLNPKLELALGFIFKVGLYNLK